MKLYIDTNVILDVVAARQPFLLNSQLVLTRCESGGAIGLTSTLSFCTAAYIMRKFMPPSKMRQALRLFRTVLTPVSLLDVFIDRAIDAPLPDFEDALQYYSALDCGADYIITRDKRHFAHCQIPVLTPDEFLALPGTRAGECPVQPIAAGGPGRAGE